MWHDDMIMFVIINDQQPVLVGVGDTLSDSIKYLIQYTYPKFNLKYYSIQNKLWWLISKDNSIQ